MAAKQFNLAAPPGFRGLDDSLPVTCYHRHLPHWRQAGATYAVTFRFEDALPQTKLQELKRHRQRWEDQHPEPRCESEWREFAKDVTRMTEKWLDEGFGECHFRCPVFAELMAEGLRFYEVTKCSVPCFVVMPNHIHAVMKPLAENQLEDVLKTMKGFVAHKINEALKQSGSLWMEESYDRIIRDEEHLYRVVQYIGRNGTRAGLSEDEYVRWISPSWVAAGWDFADP